MIDAASCIISSTSSSHTRPAKFSAPVFRAPETVGFFAACFAIKAAVSFSSLEATAGVSCKPFYSAFSVTAQVVHDHIAADSFSKRRKYAGKHVALYPGRDRAVKERSG